MKINVRLTHHIRRVRRALRKTFSDQSRNTVIVIEHNLEVINTAAHLIDLCPEGGHGGGRLVAAGPPEEVAQHPDSHTGQFLRPLLHYLLTSDDS
jgi:excinuclease UvrABC ATPase subunit